VLLEGLWGTKRDAFSRFFTDKITSRSLGAYLETEVPRIAKTYLYSVVPSVSPTFPEGDDIYFGVGPEVTPPAFYPWPLPEIVRGAPEAQNLSPSPTPEPSPTTPPAAAGPSPDAIEELKQLAALKDQGILTDQEFAAAKGKILSSSTPERPRGGWKRLRRRSPSPSPLPAAPSEPATPGSGSQVGVRPARGSRLEYELRTQDRPSHFETGSGFAIEGDRAVAFWTPDDVIAEVDIGGPGWWRVRSANVQWLKQSAATLIELESGDFAAITALPEFIGSLIVKERGVAGLIYREIHTSPGVATATERAIGDLERGGLRADAVTDMAVDLRRGKHADPVRGVISAYLYDSIDDVDSIRRMASFYVQQTQPIPYDIALLAQLEGELREGPVLWTTVPAVASREPRTDAELAVEWSYRATPEVSGPVGGVWPWLRQGWAFLDDPVPEGSTLVLPGLTEVASRLTPARFTTLDPAGGRQLAEVLQLRPRSFRDTP
jgi:hypothetical protein